MTKKKQTTPLATPLANSLTSNTFHLKTGITFTTPDKFCNAAMPAVKQEHARATFGWFAPPARPGAEDFLRCESRGMI